MAAPFDALLLAVSESDAEGVEAALNAGADVSSTGNDGQTPLAKALLLQSTTTSVDAMQVVKRLVDARADVDVVDPDGMCLLCYAISLGDGDCKALDLLLAAGATPDLGRVDLIPIIIATQV